MSQKADFVELLKLKFEHRIYWCYFLSVAKEQIKKGSFNNEEKSAT